MSRQIAFEAPATRVASRTTARRGHADVHGGERVGRARHEHVGHNVRQMRDGGEDRVVAGGVDRRRCAPRPTIAPVQPLEEDPRGCGRSASGTTWRRRTGRPARCRSRPSRRRRADARRRTAGPPPPDDPALGRAHVGDRRARPGGVERGRHRGGQRAHRAAPTRCPRPQRRRPHRARARRSPRGRARGAPPRDRDRSRRPERRAARGRRARPSRRSARARGRRRAPRRLPHAETTLPATAAACSTRSANAANSSAGSCCGPSQIASSGFGCTSTMMPSAPAAAAASDSGSTSERRPAAWLGSTITGRCDSSLSTGIGQVEREAVRGLERADPASHSITAGCPP